jgi:hypothetical protein
MNRLVLGLLSITVVACGSGAKSKEAGTSGAQQRQPIPADLRAAVERSQTVGHALFLFDRAAAIGTDLLFSKIASPEARSLAGYLTLPVDDGAGGLDAAFSVLFFTAGPEPKIAFRVHVPAFPAPPSLEEVEPPATMDENLRAYARARESALAVPRDTSQPMNPVVLPGRALGEQGIVVYLIAGTRRPDVAVFGKHYRVLVSDDGGTIRRVVALTKAVLELPLADPQASPGSRTVALTMSHLVTPYPLETHVFGSLLYGLPVYVATERGIWNVDGDRIEFVGAN